MIKKIIKRWLISLGIFNEYRPYLDGYGWAWAAVMVEELPIEEVEALICRYDGPFDRGASQALSDIEEFQRLKKERDS